MDAPDRLHSDLVPAVAAGPHRGPARRWLWRALGLLFALLLAWLIVRAYRQPDFILDLANQLLC